MFIGSQIEVGDQRFSGSFGNRHRETASKTVFWDVLSAMEWKTVLLSDHNHFYLSLGANRRKMSVLILQSPRGWGD